MTEESKSLTPKQELFVHHYIATNYNATEAAILAGYSEKTAGVIGHENLKRPEILEAVSKRKSEIVDAIKADTLLTMQQYKRLAAFDIRKLYHPDGKLKEISELDDETAAAVCGVDVIDKKYGDNFYEIVKYKTVDKRGALDSLAKIQGLLVDKHQLSLHDVEINVNLVDNED